MAIGGFTSSDPAPRPDEFAELAKAGRIRYFLNLVHDKDDQKDKTRQEATCEAEKPGDPAGCDMAQNSVGPQIEAWVKAHTPAPAIMGKVEVYDLSKLS
jgi:hypothetical protein